jgi:Aminoglycoside-2''-adenylyltransferase
LARVLNRRSVRYWLIGGWAIDAHVGRVTRLHSDIDFAVYLADREEFVATVNSHGYGSTPGAEPAGEIFTGGPVPVEVTWLVETPSGEVVTPGFEHWPYLAGSFTDTRVTVDGVAVPTMSVRGLLDTKES